MTPTSPNHFRRHVEAIEEHFVIRRKLHRVANEELCELVKPGIVHVRRFVLRGAGEGGNHSLAPLSQSHPPLPAAERSETEPPSLIQPKGSIRFPNCPPLHVIVSEAERSLTISVHCRAFCRFATSPPCRPVFNFPQSPIRSPQLPLPPRSPRDSVSIGELRPRFAAPMLTRSPPKRSFASRIRSQSAALTLGNKSQSAQLLPARVSRIVEGQRDRGAADRCGAIFPLCGKPLR